MTDRPRLPPIHLAERLHMRPRQATSLANTSQCDPAISMPGIRYVEKEKKKQWKYLNLMHQDLLGDV
jgi:hypothetical protein